MASEPCRWVGPALGLFHVLPIFSSRSEFFFFLIFFPQAGPGLSLNTSFGKGDSISIMSLRLDKLDSELCVVGGSIFLQEM